MKHLLLFAVVLVALPGGQLRAQTASDEFEIQAFTRKFLAAYNQQDEKALKKMYTKDAVRIDPIKGEIRGADKIGDYFDQQFIHNNTTLLLRPTSLTWSDREHAFVARGTYEVFGVTVVYDIGIHDTGAYANTMIKEKGEWKIARSVLTPLVKVIVYQKVNDFNEWKSVFNEGQPLRKAAGELYSEVGTLHDDPATAYVISEWTSLESFQNFFADPNLKESMEQAGVLGTPTVMILDRK